jgi:hypothetical protein
VKFIVPPTYTLVLGDNSETDEFGVTVKLFTVTVPPLPFDNVTLLDRTVTVITSASALNPEPVKTPIPA